ncbi:MAG: DUF302 domain-containing protein [Candidatus Acidiferrales bacterium]
MTIEKLVGILQANGVTIFAVIDHSGQAQKTGMRMPPAKLVLFGSPKAGTPLMVASQSIATDLQLKILSSRKTRMDRYEYLMMYRRTISNVPNYRKKLAQDIAIVETVATEGQRGAASCCRPC